MITERFLAALDERGIGDRQPGSGQRAVWVGSRANWDPAKHPRDSEGQFASVAGLGFSVSKGKRSGVAHTTITAKLYDHKKVGHIRLIKDGSEIDDLVVSPEARGKGIAHQLLIEAIDRFGNQTMRLHASPFGKGGLDTKALMALYARHGFEPEPSRGAGYMVRQPGPAKRAVRWIPADQRHYVGANHPRDPKGQWTEKGPGGLKGKNPIKAVSTVKAPNGGRWQTPPDFQTLDLGDFVQLKSGERGRVVSVATIGSRQEITVETGPGNTTYTDYSDVTQVAPKPRKPKLTTQQVIEARRGPRPKRATGTKVTVGGNGHAPYLRDELPPIPNGHKQVAAVWDQHREFIPNIDAMAFPVVADRAQMMDADTGREKRGDTEPAQGLAVQGFLPDKPAYTMVMVHDTTVDDADAVDREQRVGWATPSNARTVAEYVAAHELGHAIDFHLSDDERLEAFTTLATGLDLPVPRAGYLGAWISEHKDVLAKKTSIYATTNRMEILAEIWAEYALSTKSKPPWPWIQAVGDVMRKAAVKK